MSEELFIAFKGRHFEITFDQWSMLFMAFPHVCTIPELRKIDAWLDVNPRRRWKKPYRGVYRWFSRQPRPPKELTVGSGPVGTVRPDALERIKKREKTLDTK